ncbi:MAG: tetratricopeptide repeat protein [Nostocales cyanobacterium]|nr:MAG: tetratricopeptide repeat protein [Nostocales cyanobacterium]
MKSRGKKLEKYHKQVFSYWNALTSKPRYVVLCNFDEFWIYDTLIQIEEPVNFVKLEDLPKRYDALNFLFPGNLGFNADNEIISYDNIPPNGVLQFVGREDEVQKLDELLQQQNGRKIAVIVGMGGVGKTEFAKQYALRHLQNCRENKSNISTGGVCWLDGREGDIATQIISFARSFLNLNPPEDWDIPTQLNYCWRNWRTGEWLIVIDDVTDYGKIKPYLPPESSNFTILISRREKLGRSFAHLPLETLQPQPALDLLKSLVGAERIEQELEISEKICSWLGYLPLGLELVGRYLDRDPDLSLKTMFSLLEKKRLRHKSIIETDATMTAKLGVNDAFELSWERLDENAQELGCMLSLFALADIPWDLVKQAYQNLPVSENEEIDLDIVEEARGDLLDFNLLERTGQGSYIVHPLIREFLRYKLENLGKVDDFKTGFVNAIVEIAKEVPDYPISLQTQTFSPVMPHIAEVAKGIELRNLLNDENLLAPFLGLGRFYKGQGLYNQAEPWFEKCLSVVQTHFVSDHPHIAASLNNLADIYEFQGRYNEAEPLYLQSLEIQKRLHIEENLLMASTLNNLAGIYYRQKQYNKAKPLYLQVLELQKRLGVENRDIAKVLQNLAELYAKQGCYTEAETLFFQVLKIFENLHIEDCPLIAASLNNLGVLYRSQGRYSEAEPILVEALSLRKTLLPENHPDVAESLYNLSRLYLFQGLSSEAEPILIQALDIWKRQLGDDHPLVDKSQKDLALLYKSQRRYREAEPLLLEILERETRLLGEDHLDVVKICHSLAECYHDLSCYNEAEIWYLKSLEILKRLSREESQDRANIISNLANLYFEQKRYNDAEPLLVKALEIYQQQLGVHHPDSVNCREGLGMIRYHLKCTNSELPNFKPKSKKGNSQNKPKGFGEK